jgi:hypothetical protein
MRLGYNLKMPTQATYEDANLILRLYELRREEKLRAAREWFGMNFTATTVEEVQQLIPMGSKENAYFRMVVSYWDMAASFITSGVLNQDLFFQSNGELLFVWEKVRPIVPGFRAMMKSPEAWKNLETVGNAYIQHMKSKGPEAYETFQNMIRTMAAPKEKARAQG